VVSSAHRGALFSTACDLVHFSHAISDPGEGFLTAETIQSRHDAPLDVAGFYNVGRGVMNYHGFGAGDLWGHGGDGMHGHSSMIGYNHGSKNAVVVLVNLDSLYIQDDFSLHWSVFSAFNAAQE